MMNNDWREVKDAKTGRTYYANVKTRETRWTRPPTTSDTPPPPPPPPPTNASSTPSTTTKKTKPPPPPMDNDDDAVVKKLQAQLSDAEGRCRLYELSTEQMKSELKEVEDKLSRLQAKYDLVKQECDVVKRENASLKKSLSSSKPKPPGTAPPPAAAAASHQRIQSAAIPVKSTPALNKGKGPPILTRAGTVTNMKKYIREADEWSVLKDPNTGKEYYSHSKTGTTSWERPKALGGIDCVWKSMPDASTGIVYYYNSKTKETSWEKPKALQQAELEAKSIREALENNALIDDKSDDDDSDVEYDMVCSVVKRPGVLSHSDSTYDLDVNNLKRRASLTNQQKNLQDIKSIPVHLPVAPDVHSLTDTHMKEHNMNVYANKNFQQLKSGVFSKQTVAEMLSFSKKPLSGSLHTPIDGDFSANAQQTFRNIQSFMGDRKSSKDKMGHVQKLCRMGMVQRELLRDEILCQLCKQVTNNPDRVSKMKGWTLMAIVLGVFGSSKRFTRTFQTFLREYQKDFDSNVATWAKYCEDRLYQSLEKGVRTTTPTAEEVTAVEEMRPLNFRIYFPRGTSKSLAVESQTSAADVVVAICRILGLPLEEHGHIIWGVSHIGANEQEISLSFKSRLLDTRALYMQESKSDNPELQLSFKPRLFYESVYSKLEEEAIIEMYFRQAVQDIVDAYYICSPKEAITLAALEYVSDYGCDDDSALNTIFTEARLPSFFSKHVLQKYQLNRPGLRTAFLEEKKKLKGISKNMARRQYIDTVQAMPMYGCNFFNATRKMARGGVEEVVVGVSARGIFTMHPITKEPLGKPVSIADIIEFDQRHEDVSYRTADKEVKLKTKMSAVLYNRVSAYRQALVAAGSVKPRSRTIVE